MNWTELTIFTSREGIEPLCAVLLEQNVQSFIVEDPDELRAFADENSDMWDMVDDDFYASLNVEPNIKIYLEDTEAGKALFSAVSAAVGTLRASDSEHTFGSLQLCLSALPDTDWENAWKAYFKPFEVASRLAVCPSWEHYDNPENRLVLRIDPGTSFGSGLHETTKLCMAALERYVKSGDTVLDVGCGSGILSVAAAKLGAGRVLGIDIDENAVLTSRRCAEDNEVADCCEFVVGDLTEKITERADVVVGNLFANIIVRLLPDISRVTKPSGIIILSGIIADTLPDVKTAVTDNSLELLSVEALGQWYTVIARVGD